MKPSKRINGVPRPPAPRQVIEKQDLSLRTVPYKGISNIGSHIRLAVLSALATTLVVFGGCEIWNEIKEMRRKAAIIQKFEDDSNKRKKEIEEALKELRKPGLADEILKNPEALFEKFLWKPRRERIRELLRQEQEFQKQIDRGEVLIQ